MSLGASSLNDRKRSLKPLGVSVRVTRPTRQFQGCTILGPRLISRVKSPFVLAPSRRIGEGTLRLSLQTGVISGAGTRVRSRPNSVAAHPVPFP